MLPILPKEMLWTDKISLDEFVELDPVNRYFRQTLASLRGFLFKMDETMLMVFNEVYYQVTRMQYEKPKPVEMQKYIADIKANAGFNYLTELIMSMTYFIFKLMGSRSLNAYTLKAISDQYSNSIYWKHFEKCYNQLKTEGKHFVYTFPPCPCEPECLTIWYVNWKEITRGFDMSCIEHVIHIWGDLKDQRLVAHVILGSYLTYAASMNYNKSDIDQMRRFIKQYAKDKGENDTENMDQLRERLNAMEIHIKELEAEKTRLTTLLENKKNASGKDRKFTLVQIVDYCKSCIEWHDVQSIVAMLNKMLRIGCTKEDSDLVDSIEAEFRERRMGNPIIEKYIAHQQVDHQINNVETGATGVKIVNPKN